jgi:small subunit ribosomal protein S20
MPNIKSAVKRMRQNVKLRENNRAQRATMRTAVKKIRTAIAARDAEQISAEMRPALSSLGKMAQKKQIHKNKASRLQSRLAKAAHAVQTKTAVSQEAG